MELPPGFRFHPTDEELITCYLSPKALDSTFCAIAITDVDLNKVEPWDLPWKAKVGEREWYFFCIRDKKYPTGLRTNRATVAGYWKATGKDKEIFKEQSLVGMKKTLVFYKGRAPRGDKTNWVMHEYRLEGKYSSHKLSKSFKDDWVICRIFRKSSCGKKTHISNLVQPSNHIDEDKSSSLPPLMDLSSHSNEDTKATAAATSHVTCFSDPMKEEQGPQKLSNLHTDSSSSANPSHASESSVYFPEFAASNSFFVNPFEPYVQYVGSVFVHGRPALACSTAEPSSQQDTDVSSALSNHQFGQTSYEVQGYPNPAIVTQMDPDSFWTF